MAVFLERAKRGSSFTPPAATCVGGHTNDFTDVACPDFFANFIEQLFKDGITGGCGTGTYCPNTPVTQAQMAVFLERTKRGASFTPPAYACVNGHSGDFFDVPCPDFFQNFIEQEFKDGIALVCGPGLFCPNSAVTRAQMATLMVRAFNLQ